MQPHNSHAVSGLVVLAVSVLISLLTYFMGYTVITVPVVIGGTLICLKEILAYYGTTPPSSNGGSTP